MFRSLARAVYLVGSVGTLCVLPLSAQEKPIKETKEAVVPQSAQPPAGLCRVWLNDVPASQQPAATDCASAIKNRPQNARVVFGNLRDEAAKAPPNGSTAQPSQRPNNNWPPRANDSRRFDTSPGIPPRQNPNQTQNVNDLKSVRTVNSTVPVVRPPTPDSVKVRKPEL